MYFLEFEFKVEMRKNGAGFGYNIFIIAVLLPVKMYFIL